MAAAPTPAKVNQTEVSITGGAYPSIRAWSAAQDPFLIIGKYVDLDSRGGGRCPFGSHHANGQDDHSFQVYTPGAAGGYCYYCHVEGAGGSVFDFLRRYHGLSAKDLWRKILAGESF
jgi:hypothetical protein